MAGWTSLGAVLHVESPHRFFFISREKQKQLDSLERALHRFYGCRHSQEGEAVQCPVPGRYYVAYYCLAFHRVRCIRRQKDGLVLVRMIDHGQRVQVRMEE